MSANICWRPVSIVTHDVPVWAASSFIESMKLAFGQKPPWKLGPANIPTLRGMASVCGYGEAPNPYAFLISKIESGGEVRTIEVWPEY